MKNTTLTEQEETGEVLEIGIDHPFLAEFKLMLNRTIGDAVYNVSKDTTASISAKIEVNESWLSNPEEDSKIIEPVEFTIGLTTKRDFDKRKGFSRAFMTKMVDGHLLIMEIPDAEDAQIQISEIEPVATDIEPETDIGEQDAPCEEEPTEISMPDCFQ